MLTVTEKIDKWNFNCNFKKVKILTLTETVTKIHNLNNTDPTITLTLNLIFNNML